jgi:polyhydroxyalkanoate synthesis regulator phasin
MNSQETERFVFETKDRINKLMDDLVEQGILKE